MLIHSYTSAKFLFYFPFAFPNPPSCETIFKCVINIPHPFPDDMFHYLLYKKEISLSKIYGGGEQGGKLSRSHVN